MEVKANQSAYSHLVEAFKVLPTAEAALKRAKDKKEGNYNAVVAAGAECDSREEWEATANLLKYNITHNIDGLAKTLKAEPREDETEGGAKFKMPRSITNAMSVIGFAWENNVPLMAKDEKDGKIKPVSFGSLRKARTAKLDEQKVEEAKTLTGVAKYRFEIGQMLGQLSKVAGEDIGEERVNTLHAGLTKLIGQVVEQKQAPRAVAGRGRGKAAEKAGRKAEDVGAALSKVA